MQLLRGMSGFGYGAHHHLRTPSVDASGVEDAVSPRALAVLRSIAKSTFVDCCTGRSAGFSPFKNMVAELMLDNRALKEVVRKKF